MPLEELAELLSVVPSERLVEATLECAPGTVTAEWARQWKALGINRVSLGVQSFVDSELRQTGRRHTAAIVENDVAVLRDAGLDNINVDLIAGLPGQTMASWDQSLSWIERIRPPHVSVYIFEMDEESRLGKEAMLGGVRYGAAILPSDDLIADLYEVATDRLHDHGIYRYEISNFAEPGRESKHNLKYWKLEQYVGFGLDAHSFEGGRRWGNPDTLDDYLDGSGAPSYKASDTGEEHFFVGLRLTRGIEPTAAEWSRFAEPIEKWTSMGMLQRDGGTLRLSNHGILLSNEVLQEFIEF